MLLKLLQKKWLKKTAEATADLIRNKIADKSTRFSKNNSETNDEKKEILRESCIYISISQCRQRNQYRLKTLVSNMTSGDVT